MESIRSQYNGFTFPSKNEKWAQAFSETDADKKWENGYTILNHYFSIT
jgi:hypothetical protein